MENILKTPFQEDILLGNIIYFIIIKYKIIIIKKLKMYFNKQKMNLFLLKGIIIIKYNNIKR